MLVTGGLGFIGSEVVSILLKEHDNVKVKILDDLSFGLLSNVEINKSKNLEVFRGDLRNGHELPNAVFEDVDYVFHLAARPFVPESYINPIEVFKVNALGTLNLLIQAIEYDVRCFVHVSTSEVYGTAQHLPVDENHLTNPHSTYAASKLAGEKLAWTMHKEHSFPVVIVRPFNTYGPKDSHPRVIPEIISQLSKGSELRLGNITATRDFTFVSDIARGIILAANMKSAIGEVINLGSGVETRVEELIPLVARMIGSKRYKVSIDQQRLRPFDVQRLCAKIDEAKHILNWKPIVNLEEGLRRTVEWYVSNRAGWRWESPDYRKILETIYGKKRELALQANISKASNRERAPTPPFPHPFSWSLS